MHHFKTQRLQKCLTRRSTDIQDISHKNNAHGDAYVYEVEEGDLAEIKKIIISVMQAY